MEFEINKANLLAQIKILQNIATSKLAKTNPVLENLLIEAKENKLTITASNMSVRGVITLDFGLNIKKEGRILVNAQRFVSVCETFKQAIDFKADEKEIILSEDKIKIKLPKTVLEYPENLLNPYKYDTEFELNSESLKEGLLKVVDFRKLDAFETVGGVNFKIDAAPACAVFKLCATDGNKLAVYSKDLSDINNFSNLDFILSADIAILLSKTLAGDKVKIKISEKRVYFEFESIILETLLISGMYPKYEGIIPKYNENDEDIKTLILNKNKLEDLFKKTNILRDFAVKEAENNKKTALYNIVFECGLITKVKFADILEDYIDAEFRGEPITIAFNPDYLALVLKAIKSDKITFLMKDAKAPILFNEENYTALVMPVFLGR